MKLRIRNVAYALSAVAIGGLLGAASLRAQNPGSVTPAPIISGGDYSANAGSTGGLTLLATIPPVQPNGLPRQGYVIQNQSINNVTVSFDPACATCGASTLFILAPAAAAGGQGGSIDFGGSPHSGQIRIYGSAGAQVGARAW
jgi:hypothetical protein